MKITNIITILLALIVLSACRESQNASTKNVGFLNLTIAENQKFNPNSDQGFINNFRVTVTGDDLESPIVKYFPADTPSANFDGFAHGATVQVAVEAINSNGSIVRRGHSGDITVEGGKENPATIEINNVPIFANVRDGATVNASRFVPKVFAPGEIPFEITDHFEGEVRTLRDRVTGEASFSISETESKTSVKPVYIEKLHSGEHQLSVRDPETGETTEITVNVFERPNYKALTTTAGGFVGAPVSASPQRASNLLLYYMLMVD